MKWSIRMLVCLLFLAPLSSFALSMTGLQRVSGDIKNSEGKVVFIKAAGVPASFGCARGNMVFPWDNFGAVPDPTKAAANISGMETKNLNSVRLELNVGCFDRTITLDDFLNIGYTNFEGYQPDGTYTTQERAVINTRLAMFTGLNYRNYIMNFMQQASSMGFGVIVTFTIDAPNNGAFRINTVTGVPTTTRVNSFGAQGELHPAPSQKMLTAWQTLAQMLVTASANWTSGVIFEVANEIYYMRHTANPPPAPGQPLVAIDFINETVEKRYNCIRYGDDDGGADGTWCANLKSQAVVLHPVSGFLSADYPWVGTQDLGSHAEA